MEKQGKYLFYARASAMSLLLACISMGHAYADEDQVMLTAARIEISADCVTDSVTDLSGGEIVDHDYGIRLRWDGDTLVDMTTIDMRCDFTCKGDSLLLTMIETGSNARLFPRPVHMNAPCEFLSDIKPFGGVDGKSAGRANNYVTRSMLINTQGDTLNTLMNKQLFVSTMFFPSDNPNFNRIAVKEFRSYYQKNAPFPIAVISTTSYYDSQYRGIGGDVVVLDLISEKGYQAAANVMYKNKALAALSPFSRMPRSQQAPGRNLNPSSQPGGPEATIEITHNGNSININVAGTSGNVSQSYRVIVSDVRGIVWYAGDFHDSTVIPTSSYPLGEYQITVSDGTTVRTEKLTF